MLALMEAFEDWARTVAPPAGTVGRYRAAFRALAGEGITHVEQLGVREEFARYQFVKRKTGISCRTLNVDLAAVITLFRWLKKRGLARPEWIEALVDHKLPPEEPPPPTYYTRAEWTTLTAAAREIRPWLPLILDVLTYTGVRVGEAVRIYREDLDLGDRRVLVVSRKRGDTKSHKERVVPLCSELLERLRANAPAAGPLFPTSQRARSRYGAEHLTARSVQEAVAELGGAVGIAATPHKSRRTFTTWALRAGVPAPTVARWLGHADLTMLFRHYLAHIPAYDPAVERLSSVA